MIVICILQKYFVLSENVSSPDHFSQLNLTDLCDFFNLTCGKNANFVDFEFDPLDDLMEDDNTTEALCDDCLVEPNVVESRAFMKAFTDPPKINAKLANGIAK